MSAHCKVTSAIPEYEILRSSVEREEFVAALAEELGISTAAVRETIADFYERKKNLDFETKKKQAIVKIKAALDGGNVNKAAEILQTITISGSKSDETHLLRFEQLDFATARQELKSLGEPLVTGFPNIDKEVLILPGTLTVFAGRPGGGKTSWALAEALNIVRLNPSYDTLYVSTEMQRGLLCARIVAQSFDLNHADAKAAILQPENLPKEKWEEIEDLLPSVLCDECLDIHDLCQAVDQYAQTHSNRRFVLIVDYLTNLRSDEDAERRDIEVGKIIQDLRKVATNYQVPVIVLAQLNREAVSKKKTAEQGNRKTNDQDAGKPALHHLRESGVIEAEASVVLAIWKANPDQICSPSVPVSLRITCLKNRFGASGQDFSVYLSNPGGLIYEQAERYSEKLNGDDDEFI